MYTRNGIVPGEAIKEQFRKASLEILADPRKAQVWYPILQGVAPGLLAQCDNASSLAKNLVVDWLSRYMFRALPDGQEKATKVADFLSDHNTLLSHARRVKIEHLVPLDIAIKNLRTDHEFYNAIWDLYCIVDILLANTGIFKIFYNSANQSMFRQNVQFVLPQAAPSPAPSPAPPANRAERRRRGRLST
jgi:hypothetical protein